jgi:hypothetical protein
MEIVTKSLKKYLETISAVHICLWLKKESVSFTLLNATKYITVFPLKLKMSPLF